MYEDSALARELGAFREDAMDEAEFMANALPEELEEKYPQGIPAEVLEAYYEALSEAEADE